MFLNLLFFVFAGIAMLASLGVLFFSKTTYNVLSLVLVFLATAGTFVLVHAPFLGMVLIILYVGAVAVFFLFAVMLFGSQLEKSPLLGKRSLGIGVTIVLFLGFVLALFLIQGWAALPLGVSGRPVDFRVAMIGGRLYTVYVTPLLAVALALLAAIFGGIYLTQQQRSETKKQRAFLQNTAQGHHRLTYMNVSSHEGVEDD